MNKAKRLLVIIALVCICIFSSVCAIGIDSNQLGNKTYESFASEEEVIEAWGNFTAEEQRNYAGMFINDNNQIVLQFTDNGTVLATAKQKNLANGNVLSKEAINAQQSVVIQSANYTLSELQLVYNLLSEFIPEYDDVTEIFISNQDNCIKIGVSSIDSINSLENEVSELILANTGITERNGHKIVTFFETEDKSLCSYKTSINGNSQLYTTDITGFSAAVRWYSSVYGEGFITTGHGPAVGDKVKFGSKTIGRVKAVNHDGYDDTAFVAFDSGYSWESITNLYEAMDSYTPIENSTINLRGYNSAPYVSGRVYSNSYTYTNKTDGITWRDMIRVSVAVQSGDSGGAAYYGTIDAGRTTRVFGVISAGSDTYTIVSKAGNMNGY